MKSTKDNAVYIEAVSEQENGYAASGVIDLDAVPADGNYVELNGTKFTFRDDPDVDNDVAIGSDATESVTNLLAEALPDVATYTQNGTEVTITYKTIGADGNDYTIDCDYVGGLIDTLSGGSDTPDSDWVQANGTTVGFTPKEIVVDSDSTSTALKSYTAGGFAENDEVILVNSDNSFVDGVLGSVNSMFENYTEIASTTDAGGNIGAICINPSLTKLFTSDSYDDVVVSYDLSTAGDITTLGNKQTFNPDDIADLYAMHIDFNSKVVYVGSASDDKGVYGYTMTDQDITTLTSVGDPLVLSDYAKAIYATGNLLFVGYYSSVIETYDISNGLSNGVLLTSVDLGADGLHAISFSNNGKFLFEGRDASILAHTLSSAFNTTDIINTTSVDLGSDNLMGITVVDDGCICWNKGDDVLRRFKTNPYTADISAYNLSDAPVKAFFNDDLDVAIAIEDNKAMAITKPNKYIGILSDTATDGSNIVTLDEVKIGERLVIDGVSALVGDVTDDGGDPVKYTVPIDNHNLTTTPKRAFKLGQELLAKESSTTTQFIGTSAYSGLLSTGDVVALDDVEVVASGVGDIVDESIIGSTDPFGDGSLVAKYLLDGDATDLTGNYNGTATDVTYEAGKFGDCCIGNGDSSKIELNSHDDLADITVSYWCYNADAATTYAYQDDDNRGSTLVFQKDSTTMQMGSVRIGGSWTEGVDVTVDDTTDTWIHIVVVIRGSVRDTYLNNEKIDTTDNANLVPSALSSSTLYLLGGSSAGYGSSSIDQVEVYNRALTSDEVTALYNQAAKKYTIDFAEQASAPTICGIPDKSTQLTVASKTFDGTKFTNTYSDLEKQGRAFQRKVTAEKKDTVVLEPLQTQMWKDQ